MEAFTISTSLVLKKSVWINIDLSLEILRDLKITTRANFWGNSTENPGDMFLCNNKIYLLNTTVIWIMGHYKRDKMALYHSPGTRQVTPGVGSPQYFQ